MPAIIPTRVDIGAPASEIILATFEYQIDPCIPIRRKRGGN